VLTFLEVSFLVSALEALPIKGDAVQLQHVILNMIVNGVEAISAIRYGCAVIGRIELNERILGNCFDLGLGSGHFA
jgi:phosphoglycerate-specific signal transduction histidine kinase